MADDPMPDDRLLSVVHRYFECINAEDWDALKDLWHDDATFAPVGAAPRHGIADILTFYKKLFVAWAMHRDTPTRLLPSGSSVTAEVRFDGETPDGQLVSFDAVDVFDIVDGRIKRLTNWYDIALVRKMLAAN